MSDITLVSTETRKNLPVRDFKGSIELIYYLSDGQRFSISLTPDEKLESLVVKQFNLARVLKAYCDKNT